MGNQSKRPKHLAAKLRAIRHGLKLSQSQLLKRLDRRNLSYTRISEYETGARVPSMITVLAYAKVARVRVEILIDDKLSLPERFKPKP